MEGITASVYKGLKEYWVRRGYQRINGPGRGRRRNRVELGTAQTRRGRLWRWRIKLSPKIRFQRIPSPKKMLIWVRDAYVNMMLSLANSRVATVGASAGAFGGGACTAPGWFARAPQKEYDEKVLLQIYKSLLMARGQHVVPPPPPPPHEASRIVAAD